MKLLTCAHWLTYAHVAALAHLGACSTRARIFFLMQIRRDTAISTTITSWTGLRREQDLFIQFRISHSTSGSLFPVSKPGRQRGGGGGVKGRARVPDSFKDAEQKREGEGWCMEGSDSARVLLRSLVRMRRLKYVRVCLGLGTGSGRSTLWTPWACGLSVAWLGKDHAHALSSQILRDSELARVQIMCSRRMRCHCISKVWQMSFILLFWYFFHF